MVVNSSLTVLEKGRPISKSLLWRLQRRFFQNRGIQAWSQGIVPHYITTNPFIANAYAQVVKDFISDFATLDTSQPLYIIELGSGAGRFAYRFIKRFFEHICASLESPVQIKYVMTDFTKSNLEFWQQHPRLQPYIEKGLLDFALFDLEQDNRIKLLNSGQLLTPNTVKNPLVVLANYVFDSVPQDIFQLKDNQLYECQGKLISVQRELDLSDPEILNRANLSYEMVKCTAKYYQDPLANQVLTYYCQNLANSMLVFPVAAIQCFKHLQTLGNGNLLVLTGDKGYIHENALVDQEMPTLVKHGSFSMSVNYHALKKYVELKDGQVLHTPHPHNSLNIVAFLLSSQANNFSNTRNAYQKHIVEFGPDDFYTIKKALDRNRENCSLAELITFLRTSLWDADVLINYYPTLLAQLPSAPEALKQEVKKGFQQAWDLYYPIGEPKNFAYYLGSLSTAMGYFDQALGYFQQAMESHSPEPKLAHNLAVCYYHVNQLDQAWLETIERLTKDPQNEALNLLLSELKEALNYRDAQQLLVENRSKGEK